jgi:hypothetical protein
MMTSQTDDITGRILISQLFISATNGVMARSKQSGLSVSFDQFINYSGWLVGVAGFGFGIWQYRASQSRPTIVDVRAGMRATGTIASGQRSIDVTAVSVKVENKGIQSAKCTGLVHFSRSHALPLYLVVRGRAQQSQDPFVVEGKDEVDLVAAWDIQDGVIGMGSVAYADFVRDYLPATVVLTCGKRTIKATLSERDFTDAHQTFEQQCFRMGS